MADRPILFSAPMVRALLDGRKTQTRRVLKPQPKERDFRNVRPDEARWFYDPVRGGMWIADGVAVGPFPSFAPRDRLWVREAWRYVDWTEDGQPYIGYRAGGAKVLSYPKGDWADRVVDIWADLSRPENIAIDGTAADRRWRPPLLMPRFASRLTLTVTDVRVQRLQDISEEDAVAEGFEPTIGETWWQGYRRISDDPNIPLIHNMTPGDVPPDWMIDPKPAGRSDWRDRTAVQAMSRLWNQINGVGAWEANPWVAAYTFNAHQTTIDKMETACG